MVVEALRPFAEEWVSWSPEENGGYVVPDCRPLDVVPDRLTVGDLRLAASTLSALSGEEDQGVRASVSQSGSALHGAPSGSEPSGPITGNAGLFPGVPQPLRSDLQFITAALSTYDGGPASADVHDAWGRITDQLGTEPSATHRNCVGCGAASTLENLVGWTLDQDTRQRWCPACAQPSAAGEP
jgi:hypothetical protein